MDFKKKIKTAGKFVKENKLLMLQLGLMGAVVLTNEVSFATKADETFSVVTNPLEKLQNTITGPVATAIGTAGAGLLGLSVTMNFENQIAKRAIQGVGGVGLALGGATVVSKLGTAFLF